MMLAAFLCFSLMDSGAKWLSILSVSALQIAFMRYLGHFLCAVLFYLPTEGTAIFRARQPGLLTLRAVFLLCATLLNFSAIQHLPLNITIAIFNAMPFVVCVISIPVLGERIGVRRLGAVFGGFLGVLVILQPWDAAFDWHMLLSIGSLLCASGYFVMNRLIAGNDGNAVTQCYAAGLASLVLAPLVWQHWVWPDGILNWSVVLMLGSLGMLGHSLLRQAHRHAQASALAPTTYSQIVYITLISWWVFDTSPAQNTVWGTLIIVGSGLYLWARERRLSKLGSK